jgi:ABC-type phosphate transport system substrate-binding protein
MCGEVVGLAKSPSGDKKPGFLPVTNEQVLKKFAAGTYSVAVHRGPLCVPDYHAIWKAFGQGRKLDSVVMGEYVVHVIVNAKNPVRTLKVEALAGIYRGKTLDWEKLRGAKSGPIHIFSPPFVDTAYHIVHLNALQCYDFDKRLRDWSAKPLRTKTTSDGVIAAVAQDANAIGFFLADHREKLDERVKVLDIVPRGKKEAVAPSMENLAAGEYPLTQKLTMYLHPTAPQEAREFCEFAVNPARRGVLRKYKLFPQSDFVAFLADRRLAEMKSGRGPSVCVSGRAAVKQVFVEVTKEFVRAKVVAQLSYTTDESELSRVGSFVSGHDGIRELLLLDDKPSSKALEKYGAKWNQLMPEEFCIAGRATVIIVNGSNKLKSLTMGQLEAIFSGETNDWRVIGDTGLPAPADKAAVPIHRFCVPSSDPAAVVFFKNCLPRSDVRGVTVKKDTAAVLAAVNTDPNAIGVVDLASLPGGGLSADSLAKSGQTAKMVAIQLGTGDKARVISPTPANIRNAMYPLSQRMYLYVHPKASDTAKDYAKFIATCGGSEVTPYADTVKAVMDAFAKNGLIPLGDAALDRIAEGKIEAAKTAKDAAKPATKGRR